MNFTQLIKQLGVPETYSNSKIGASILKPAIKELSASCHKKSFENLQYEKIKGNGVAFFSLEMPAYQLINRLASSYCSIELKKIRAGTTTEQEEKLLLQTFQKLKNLNLVIDDSAVMGIFELKSKVRFLKRRNPQLKCVVIDYLQLMSGTQVKDQPRHEEIAEISRGLKAIARELEITLIALSQINRNIESREDKRPNLGDLRESGSIEQDADVIIFLYRDDVYARKELLAKKKKEEKEGKFDHSLLDIEEKPIETAELIVAKNRNGATTTILTEFNKQFTRFEERAKHQEIKKVQGTTADFAL